MVLHPYILPHVSSKNKSILLHNNNAVIKIRKLNTDLNTAIHRLSQEGSLALSPPVFNLGPCIVFSRHASLVPLIWDISLIFFFFGLFKHWSYTGTENTTPKICHSSIRISMSWRQLRKSRHRMSFCFSQAVWKCESVRCSVLSDSLLHNGL